MPWVAVGGAVLSGILGSSAAGSQNRKAEQQSAKQMAFQERMSNTAYQRSAKDLEAAGLNRILALGNPASTPGGSQAPVVNKMTSAMSAAQAATAMGNTVAQTKLTNAQTQKSLDDNYIKHQMIKALKNATRGIQQDPSSAKETKDPSKYDPEPYNVMERLRGVFDSQTSAKKRPKIDPLPPVYGRPEQREEINKYKNSDAYIRSKRREAFNAWLDKNPNANHKESLAAKLRISKRIKKK